MHNIDATDPFYTPEVIADIRKSILMRISKDKDVHRLERIRDLLTTTSFSPVVMTEDTMSVGEFEAAYYTHREVDSLRKRLQQVWATNYFPQKSSAPRFFFEPRGVLFNCSRKMAVSVAPPADW